VIEAYQVNSVGCGGDVAIKRKPLLPCPISRNKVKGRSINLYQGA
jgi:hypothetical protein